jgi:hypothetical protein
MKTKQAATKECVQDWQEAVRWVSHAIALESERLMDAGHNNPESFLQAETLREAWKRVLRG